MEKTSSKKEDTRNRILKSAGKLFRQHGVKGTSLPDVMAEAGLTVGGFYRHFESKDALVREMLINTLRRTIEFMGTNDAEGRDWMRNAAAAYLSKAHRANVSGGCPMPALASDIARSDKDTKEVFEALLNELAAEIEAHAPADSDLEPREVAWAFLSMAVGGMALSRCVADDAMAGEILRACRHGAEGF